MSDGLKLLRAVCEQGAIATLRDLSEDLFFGEKEIQAYNFTRRHFRRYSELPTPETIEQEIGKRIPRAEENADYYLDKCFNRSMFNAVREPFNSLREALMEDQPERVRDLIATMHSSISRYDTAQNLMTIGELNDTLREAYRDAASLGSLRGVTTGWDTLDEATDGYQAGDLIFYVARPKVGKCLAPDTKVMRADGSVTEIRNIKKGDMLMGPDSRPRVVEGIGQGTEEMFEVVPNKGEPWRCNKSHILSVKMSSKGTFYDKGDIINLTVEEYLGQTNKFKHHAKLWRASVNFARRKVPVEPYMAGIWLGDGTRASPAITTPEPEVLAYIEEYAGRHGYKVIDYARNSDRCSTYGITKRSEGSGDILRILLRQFVVDGEKRIPKCYLHNCRKMRLELLAGLLDTDGYLQPDGKGYEFSAKGTGLKDDFVYLCRSLGFAANASEKYVNDVLYWRVGVYGPLSDIPCKVPRKKANKSRPKRDPLVTGFTLRSVGEGEYYGVCLDGDHLYLLGDFTVTHNTNLMVHSVRTAWQAGHRVLFVSMEMTLTRLAERFHAQNAGIDPKALSKGRLSRTALRKFDESLAEVSGDGLLTLYSGKQQGTTTATLDALVQEVNPDIIFIDSFYKMKPVDCPRNTGRIERVGYVTNELKDIALERRRPIVSTTQFNRQSGLRGKSGNEDTIAFSDAILQDASLLISIKMPPWDSSERPRYRVLEIMEGREGEKGAFAINFNFTPADFSEAPESIQQMLRDAPAENNQRSRTPLTDVNYML